MVGAGRLTCDQEFFSRERERKNLCFLHTICQMNDSGPLPPGYKRKGEGLITGWGGGGGGLPSTPSLMHKNCPQREVVMS